jgi:recyclin-1
MFVLSLLIFTYSSIIDLTIRSASATSSQTTFEVPTSTAATSTPSLNSQKNTSKPTNKLELLLSLDVALELIHADRESLKRAETFAGYPGHYGHRVHDTIEEIFILLLQVLGERHMSPGFGQ